MQDKYFIEVWLRGAGKSFIRDLAQTEKIHPHVTLVPPFTLRGNYSESNLISDFTQVCAKQKDVLLLEYKNHLAYFSNNGNHILYVPLQNTHALDIYADSLESMLGPNVVLSDKIEATRTFHATIHSMDFFDLETFIEKHINIYLSDEPVLRTTLLKKAPGESYKILQEYDAVLQMPLSRNAALNKSYWEKTLSLYSSRK